MKVTRLYTGPDGESHFEDIEIPLEAGSSAASRSELKKATEISFGELYSDVRQEWHNAPRRQFVIALEGENEIEIGDGTRRRFGPGDVVLAEDTEGRGHITRGVDSRPRKVAFVTLE